MTPITIKNFLTCEDLQIAHDIVYSGDFPLYRCSIDYYGKNNLYLYQWMHLLMNHQQPNSYYCKTFEEIVFRSFERHSIAISNIYRMRIGYHTTTPLTFNGGEHVDKDIDHKVCILYLNDSDGDTILYNEEYNKDKGLDTIEYAIKNHNGNFSVYSKHSPEKNKAVIFKGNRYHSSSTPQFHKERVVLNINFS
jgi:hypothetical protein